MANKVVTQSWVLFLLLALASPCFGQLERSVIEGTVTDPHGAFTSGVKVTVMATETNVTLPTATNNAGYYRVTSLVPGKYQVHFEASGFSRLDLKDIVVPAGQTIRADAQLQLGTIQQVVEVSASASQIQTAATNFSTTVEAAAIQQIPLSGRDLQQLVFLVPGIIGNGPPGSSFGFNSQFGAFPDPTHLQGSGVSVNGGQIGSNAWYLDGNFNLASANAESVVVNPSPDAVTDFQVITNGFSAEYGRSGGAVFNVTLKSGTNKLHGSVYEYSRNSVFNARNPFTSIDSFGKIIPQNQLRFNNFGGTLGGPVVIPHLYNGRNRTFFFFSFDQTLLHLNGSGIFNVPTALERAGNFSEDPNAVRYGLWNPYSTVGPATDGTYARSAFGTPVTGSAIGCTGRIVASGNGTTAQNPTAADCNFSTQLPANMLSKTAMFFMKSFPLPNYLDPLSGCPLAAGGGARICSNYRAALGSSQNQANISLKIDHQLSEKSRFFGEWLFNPGKYTDYRVPWTGATFPAGRIGLGGQVPFDFRNQIIALGHTYTFGPTLINEARLNFTRQFYTTHPNQGAYPDSVTDFPAVKSFLAPLDIPVMSPPGVPSWYFLAPGGGNVNFGPVAWTSNYTATESYTVLDNVTKIIGKHTLRAGFVYRLSHDAEFQSPETGLIFRGGGVVNPVTGQGGGAGLAQFMLGSVMNDGSSVAYIAWAPYARYRYWGAYLQDDYRITSKLTLNLGLRYDIFGSYKTRQHPNARFCTTCPNSFTGMPGIVQYEGDPGFPMNTDIVPPNFNDIGPRVNFAYSPFADRKTVIRGGYDIFYSNAYSAVNSPQTIENAIGYTPYFTWSGSSNPAQCAPYSGKCVSWNLDSTTVNKGALTDPPFTSVFPAQTRDQLYKQPLGTAPTPVHDPMVQNWTLEVQRQLPGDMVITAGYIGSHGTHLVGGLWSLPFNYNHTADRLKYRNAINAVVPITDYYSGQTAKNLAAVWGSDSVQRSQLLTDYPFWVNPGPSNTFDGYSIYHALQLRLQKRYSHGLNFNVNYTWSKNIASPLMGAVYDNVIDPIHFSRNGTVGGLIGAISRQAKGQSFQDRDNLNGDRALAANDTPHMLNLFATYELPFGNGRRFVNRKGLVNLFLGGWRLTGNFNAQSGVPLHIGGPSNGMTDRPNLVGDPRAVPGGQNAAHWINAAAFTPPFGTDQNFWAKPDTNDDRWWQFGNAGLRLPGLRSPGFWNLDSSLGKQFHISESKYFDFRWEAFNALNHQNLGVPNTSYCLPPNSNGSTDLVHQAGCSFGRITNVQTDPRAMQFALKFVF